MISVASRVTSPNSSMMDEEERKRGQKRPASEDETVSISDKVQVDDGQHRLEQTRRNSDGRKCKIRGAYLASYLNEKHHPAPLRTRVIGQDKLYVSQPNPELFGNEPNSPTEKNWTNENWLQSRLHFSFAEYYNPKNTNFGPIRVINDDIVQFGQHPHQNMEILTYVVDGELTHIDPMGKSESLGRGSVQFISAGSVVTHSERNDGDRPLRYIQIWIRPRRRGLPTNYGSYRAPKDSLLRTNTVRYLASDAARDDIDTPAKVNQDIELMVAELDLDRSLTIDIEIGRQAYLVCIEGTLKVDGKTLSKHDGMEIVSCGMGGTLEINAVAVEETGSGHKVAHFLLLIMAAVPNSGRGDLGC